MSAYETWNLMLTGIYDLLTFGLLSFVAYEAMIKPKKPNVVLSLRSCPTDTEAAPGRAHLLDLVIDNKGADITNVAVTSTPDEINWGRAGGRQGKRTSQYFHPKIPAITRDEQLSFFWCDGRANTEVISKPITVTVEYDNPLHPVWPPLFSKKRCRSNLLIDLKVYEDVYWGINRKYDIHNVAEELSRIRRDIAEFKK